MTVFKAQSISFKRPVLESNSKNWPNVVSDAGELKGDVSKTASDMPDDVLKKIPSIH